jgi:hypothetical protein
VSREQRLRGPVRRCFVWIRYQLRVLTYVVLARSNAARPLAESQDGSDNASSLNACPLAGTLGQQAARIACRRPICRLSVLSRFNLIHAIARSVPPGESATRSDILTPAARSFTIVSGKRALRKVTQGTTCVGHSFVANLMRQVAVLFHFSDKLPRPSDDEGSRLTRPAVRGISGMGPT